LGTLSVKQKENGKWNTADGKGQMANGKQKAARSSVQTAN